MFTSCCPLSPLTVSSAGWKTRSEIIDVKNVQKRIKNVKKRKNVTKIKKTFVNVE